MHKTVFVSAIPAIVATVIMLAACENEVVSVLSNPVQIAVGAVSLSAESLTLYTVADAAGKPLTLSMNASASAVADYTWTISPGGYARAVVGTPQTAQALILPDSVGEATITVRATPKTGFVFDQTVEKTCALTVIAGSPAIPVTGIEVSETQALDLIQSNTSDGITVTIIPSNADNQNYTFSASPTGVVEFLPGASDSTKKIRAIGSVTPVTVTVNAQDTTNSVPSATFNVNITPLNVQFVTAPGGFVKDGSTKTLEAQITNTPLDNAGSAYLDWEKVGENAGLVTLNGQTHGVDNEKITVSVASTLTEEKTVTIRAKSVFDPSRNVDYSLTLKPQNMSIKFIDGTSKIVDKEVSGTGAYTLNYADFTVGEETKTIQSVSHPDLNGGAAILMGGKASNGIALQFQDGTLIFRPAVNDYIPIGSIAEFRLISGALTGKYKQQHDLDLLGTLSPPILWTAIGGAGTFSGEFDGDSKKLNNLRINSTNVADIGLFGTVGPAGKLKNIRIESGAVVYSGVSVGVLVGNITRQNQGEITNCINKASLSVSTIGGSQNYFCGGITGSNNGTISRSGNEGAVSAPNLENVGGIVGRSSNVSSIFSSYNSAAITGVIAGGIVGYLEMSLKVSGCYNTGAITGGSRAGGIAGSVSGNTVAGCYNTGAVTAPTSGGIIGYFNSMDYSVSYCYSTGLVSGDQSLQYSGHYPIRALIGVAIFSSYLVSNCFWLPLPGGPETAVLKTNPYTPTNDGTAQFSADSWPAWPLWTQTGDESSNKYYKSLGSFGSGQYPKLWWEP
jgi:hypothetical protein